LAVAHICLTFASGCCSGGEAGARSREEEEESWGREDLPVRGTAAMPKKVLGVNSKAEEARARKAATEAERKAREASEKEEAYWREAEEGGKTRAAKKKEEDAARRAEASAKKAEAKKLAEIEAKEMDGQGAKKKAAAAAGRVSIPAPKVTAAELALRREQEESRRQAEAEAARRRQLRVADPDDYARLLDAYANTNREDQLVDAHSLDTAIAQISLASSSELPVDRHPERRLKAAFKVCTPAPTPASPSFIDRSPS
jgi:hypothetical protein